MSSPTESPLKRFIPIPTEYQVSIPSPRDQLTSPRYTSTSPPAPCSPPLTARSSYTEDPKWQKKFTVIWTSVLAFALLLSVPYIVHHFRIGRLYSGLAIRESLHPSQDVSNAARASAKRDHPQSKWRSTFIGRAATGVGAMVQSLTLWTLPVPNLSLLKGEVGDCCRKAYFTLSISQIVLVMAYAAAVIACFVVGANLTQNSNRPGERHTFACHTSAPNTDHSRLPRSFPTPTHRSSFSEIPPPPSIICPFPVLRTLQLSTPMDWTNIIPLGHRSWRHVDPSIPCHRPARSNFCLQVQERYLGIRLDGHGGHH